MSDINVTVVGGSGSNVTATSGSSFEVSASTGAAFNVSTGTVVGPLPQLQIEAGTGISIDPSGGVSTISANLSELSIPTNLADLADVSSTAPTTGQALVWSGSEWGGGNISPGTTVNGLSGAVNLVAGGSVTINQTGQNVSVSANGGLSFVESPTLSIESSLDDSGNLTLDVAWPTEPFGLLAANRAPGEVFVRWQEPVPRRLRYYVQYEIAQPPNAPAISNLSVNADGLVGNITSGDDADLVEIQYSVDGTTFI